MQNREKYLERQRRYNESAKGRARHERYNASEKGRERAWRWYVAMPIEKRGPRALKDRRRKALVRIAERHARPSQSA
jgi:hypothetical protein